MKSWRFCTLQVEWSVNRVSCIFGEFLILCCTVLMMYVLLCLFFLFTGALELEGVEVQVQLDDKKDIKDLIPKKVKWLLFYHSVLYLGSEKLSRSKSASIFKPTFLQKVYFCHCCVQESQLLTDTQMITVTDCCRRGLSIKNIKNLTKISF